MENSTRKAPQRAQREAAANRHHVNGGFRQHPDGHLKFGVAVVIIFHFSIRFEVHVGDAGSRCKRMTGRAARKGDNPKRLKQKGIEVVVWEVQQPLTEKSAPEMGEIRVKLASL